MDDVRQFYMTGFDQSGYTYNEISYAKHVLERDPKRRKFRGSLLWLVDNNAISLTQANRLDDIYAHRHELTHELGKFIVDLDSEPDVQLFTDALEILRDLSRFWTQIEIDIGSFDEHGNISVDDVTPGSLLLLQMCIDAYVDGLRSDEEQESVDKP